MSFQILVTVWCAASLLVCGGLVVWFVVEMKFFVGWWSARRAPKARYVWPKARWIRRGKERNAATDPQSDARPETLNTPDSPPTRKIHF
ncbi:MAG TPA: hypothetical protein VFP84_10610 [Kofleriaceae bacterium]|nr:hypothetical protein [Kofleriaceae bacterium]